MLKGEPNRGSTHRNGIENIKSKERETDRREENTLLHKDKDLSSSRLFYKSVPDDKPSNTQYEKETDRQTGTDRQR